MAKIRDIKNEVNYLAFEVISDCNTYMSLHPENKDAVIALVEEAVALRNKLISKINHPDDNSAAYYRSIRKELLTGADQIFVKLRNLINK